MTDSVKPNPARCSHCGNSLTYSPSKLEARVKELENGLLLKDAEIAGTGAMLLTVQADCIGAERRVAELEGQRDAERDEKDKLNRCLREKDEAMGVLFKRLDDNGIDFQDLIA